MIVQDLTYSQALYYKHRALLVLERAFPGWRIGVDITQDGERFGPRLRVDMLGPMYSRRIGCAEVIAGRHLLSEHGEDYFRGVIRTIAMRIVANELHDAWTNERQ